MTGRWLIGALLLAGIGLTVASYLPALDAGFFFDDDPNIVQTDSVHWTELSLENLGALARDHPKRRRLVANTTFALNHLAGGLEPRGYHRANLSIHLAVGASLAWLAWLYLVATGRPESRRIAALAAAAAAVLFLLHPLNTQAVTYVVQRASSLATLFSLWTLALYLMARRARLASRAGGLYAAALVTWALAVASKENALILPGVVLAHEACFHRREWVDRARGLVRGRPRAALVAALALAVAAFLILQALAGWSGTRWSERFPGREFTGQERVLTQSRVQLSYLGLLLWPSPSRLNLDHDYAVSRSLLDPPQTAVAIGFWALALAAAVVLARRRPRSSFPLLAYLILHGVEAAPINLELMFEHRMYLPMTALALLAAVLIVDLPARSRRIAVALALVAALPLAAATHRRNVVWSDPIGLHYDVARKSPEKFRPQLNLGTQLGMAGRYEEALPFLREAVRLDPGSAKAHNQLGTAHLRLRRLDEALPRFYQAVALDPEHAYAHYNIASILDQTGRSREALPYMRRFLELAPAKLAAFRAPVEQRVRQLTHGPASPDD